MGFIFRLLIMAVVCYFLQNFLNGVHFADFGTAIVFAVVLGLLNTFVKPVLKFFSFPISLITFGLFSLIINAVVVVIAEYFVEGVSIDGFLWALIFGCALSVVNFVISIFTED